MPYNFGIDIPDEVVDTMTTKEKWLKLTWLQWYEKTTWLEQATFNPATLKPYTDMNDQFELLKNTSGKYKVYKVIIVDTFGTTYREFSNLEEAKSYYNMVYNESLSMPCHRRSVIRTYSYYSD